jgi:hypothetical protein
MSWASWTMWIRPTTLFQGSIRVGSERMRPFTAQRGVDSPSGEITICLEFWFLILDYDRFVCIALYSYHMLFMPCILAWNHTCFILMFSLAIMRNVSVDTLLGVLKKHVGRLLFCFGNSNPIFEDRFALTLHARIRFYLFPNNMLLLFC